MIPIAASDARGGGGGQGGRAPLSGIAGDTSHTSRRAGVCRCRDLRSISRVLRHSFFGQAR